jgi:hypothetical protein
MKGRLMLAAPDPLQRLARAALARPDLPHQLPWFGSSDYWRGQVDMLHEQIEAMQEEPLVA